ncbi:oxidoreductase, short chain dehydrogenase reductase family protein [Agrilactobacillus composti DSM 18527 = JCM 14202]|uniref:Oxidoreductase, short chain dehydrogenase reductase family protein n=1 Tax=Agrilactobacillus composti DSM 18527 = JCM 14202 TaxID=1423734 RepID=X0PCY8_9LACO|nr:SDR family NAD(P)-dependent oxidoreductase [Agrilactobacillus composti]KRM33133.1 oxidoreductase, short chain dehydrogenase reductase family protein [Agrilactobacillus composti DSM 18527 = JCM 14202]GAF38503.1 probable short-chain dehydrogenase [Agrilactobacillus composti DSM 18527 = JCM 14202]
MKIAIITGASSGLGHQYVHTVAKKMPTLDEIWIIARRKDRLVQLAEEMPTQRFRALPYDLTDAESFHKLQGLLDKEKPQVQLLINNAGVLHNGPVASVPIEQQQQMIALNAIAPVMMVNAVLPYMQRHSSIINVASVAGFTPSPNMVVYGATKAFLLFYTKGLHAELRARGIHVLALAPGNMHTALFSATAPGDPADKKSIVDYLPFLDLPKITRRSLTIAKMDCMVYTPRLFYKLYRTLTTLVPASVMTRFSKV